MELQHFPNDNSGRVDSAPAVVNGVVFVTSVDFKVFYTNPRTFYMNQEIFALNASNGAKIWNYSLGPNSQSKGSPAVQNGIVIVGSFGNISALNATNGNLIWNFKTNGAVQSSPTIVNGIVYIGSLDGPNRSVYALALSTGTKLWNASIDGVYSSPAVVNNIVYVGSNNGNFYALNSANSNVLWIYTPQIYSSHGNYTHLQLLPTA
jgi:outer membrane protein assembly factor BamB